MPSVNGRAQERQDKRRRLFRKQAGKCYWCRRPMTLQRSLVPLPEYATFEHIVPRGLGGIGDDRNVVLACHACNQKRGTGAYETVIAPMWRQ